MYKLTNILSEIKIVSGNKPFNDETLLIWLNKNKKKVIDWLYNNDEYFFDFDKDTVLHSQFELDRGGNPSIGNDFDGFYYSFSLDEDFADRDRRRTKIMIIDNIKIYYIFYTT